MSWRTTVMRASSRHTAGRSQGNPLELALKYSIPEGDEFAFLADVALRPREEVRSGGYVLDTLGAAIWCLANTSSYAECVLAAVFPPFCVWPMRSSFYLPFAAKRQPSF